MKNFFLALFLEIRNPRKLVRNAAAFDPMSTHKSGMPGKESFVAMNYTFPELTTGVLKYIFRERLFDISARHSQIVAGIKFDFKVPMGDFKTVQIFLKNVYGIKLRKTAQILPTLVFSAKDRK